MPNTGTDQQLPALIVRRLAEAASLPLDPGVALTAEIGSEELPIGSIAYVQGLIAVEDELGVAFADKLFAEVRKATLGDVVAYAWAAVTAAEGA
ncbi:MULTISPECIES: hypothetical protein [Kitasatospora]|uniref:Carrier domain-containing protein n=1 Tax=Kitasatospora setae (strain ATCC 33774 / DSM 43861 / JCM 3304 / KCC A-0304 / NBRC 14216 / KM-6054) TaxID=452652 RepID=E4N8H3_KITSK|nr:MULTISPECIES: hypothetical protein [Kitasatospora]BAJ27504.1 hypothetical protein KSE_16790 [Kitasatospora setae KM-6054]